jgi:hypothetical protein
MSELLNKLHGDALGARRVEVKLFLCLILAEILVSGAEVKVNNAREFRAAVSAAKPGTRILLGSGNYGGGFYFADLRGEKDNPIVIAAADPAQPPVFSQANVAMHLSNPAFLELHHLVLTKLAQNGINIDDGRNATNQSARGIVLSGLRITDVGSTGNHDGIKLSGIWNFMITNCSIERWGTVGGSAIDMVGCHRGVIEGCTIKHIEPEPPNCTGVQAKGGTSEITVRRNRFESAGGRAVNIGGSTGLKFFRPPLVNGPTNAEARNIRVEGNTFIGSSAPIAFVGVDGAVVRFNTIEKPSRWVARILQETKGPQFVACRNGEFTDNIILFEASRGTVNVGGGTQPETFKFARNWWYCVDNPGRSRVSLPVPEADGVYGRPMVEAKGKAGAGALPH